MPDGYVSLILGGVIILQQVYFMRQIQKLIDKNMCRSYPEYQRAIKKEASAKVQLDTEPVEDLRPLQEFQV